MFPRDPDFWAPIDLRQHLDEIEAPILFQVASREIVNVVELARGMSDARLPFEAFSFNDELHLNWQPAHKLAIYNRNLDWFRFWLQDIEDPDRAKAEQYERWRQLRELQCRNARFGTIALFPARRRRRRADATGWNSLRTRWQALQREGGPVRALGQA